MSTSCPGCAGPLDATDRFCRQCGRSADGSASAGSRNLEGEIQSLLAAGQKIEAIKRYREETGCDLLTAKNAVEALEAGRVGNLRMRDDDRDFRPAEAAPKPGSSGLLLWLLAFLVVGFFAAILCLGVAGFLSYALLSPVGPPPRAFPVRARPPMVIPAPEVGQEDMPPFDEEAPRAE